LMGPKTPSLDYHEVGRSLSTLMADEHFHDTAYVAAHRSDILDSLNDFLKDSMVLPPGEWDKA
ncbi:hypothetical protein HELRODRAFT_138927, partial [Helobdella robusta]|uniref:Band 3 cytoplasmic domain-containing protein n=1 Tax=Helobdella robusta TaxID=6412 RepID=T1EIY1_HELRO